MRDHRGESVEACRGRGRTFTLLRCAVFLAVAMVLLARGEGSDAKPLKLRYAESLEGRSYFVTQTYDFEPQGRPPKGISKTVVRFPRRPGEAQSAEPPPPERHFLWYSGEPGLADRWNVPFFVERRPYGAPEQKDGEAFDADVLIRQFDALPVLPEAPVSFGDEWKAVLRVRFREARYAVPIAITQRLVPIEAVGFTGRPIQVIVEYDGFAVLDTAEHAEMLATTEERASRPKFSLAIHGRARIDVSSGIVLKKDQNAEWGETVTIPAAEGGRLQERQYRCYTGAWLMQVPDADVDRMIELGEKERQKEAKNAEAWKQYLSNVH